MKQGYLRIIGCAAFLLLCVGLTMYLVLRGQDLPVLLDYLKNSSQRFWMAGFSVVICYIAMEAIVIYYLLKSFGEKALFTHCLLYSFVGFFFGLATPAAVAGQPMQLVFMKRDGLSMSRCIVALLMVALTFKLVLVIIGIVVLFIRPANLGTLMHPALFWMWLGMALNTICIVGMLLLIFVPSIARRIVFGGIAIAERFAGETRANKWRESMLVSMERYSSLSVFLRNNIRVGATVVLLTIAQRCMLFAITYLVLISFGIHALTLGQTVLMQGSISLSADMLPLPGGVGISEFLYTRTFKPIIGETLTAASLVISRGLSYYSQLLISAVFTGVAYVVIFMKKRPALEAETVEGGAFESASEGTVVAEGAAATATAAAAPAATTTAATIAVPNKNNLCESATPSEKEQ